MDEFPIKSQTIRLKKNSKKFFGVLRHLAKSDSSLKNELKVTVCKDDPTEAKKQIIIAPSLFINSCKINYNSTQNTNINILEDLITKNQNTSPIDAELKDYPDSSDFDDDEE